MGRGLYAGAYLSMPTYVQMIKEAIESSRSKMLQASQIFSFIEQRYPERVEGTSLYKVCAVALC